MLITENFRLCCILFQEDDSFLEGFFFFLYFRCVTRNRTSQIELAPRRTCALCASVSTGLYGWLSYVGTLDRVPSWLSVWHPLCQVIRARQRKGPVLLFLRNGCLVLLESKVSRLGTDVTDWGGFVHRSVWGRGILSFFLEISWLHSGWNSGCLSCCCSCIANKWWWSWNYSSASKSLPQFFL